MRTEFNKWVNENLGIWVLLWFSAGFGTGCIISLILEVIK